MDKLDILYLNLLHLGLLRIREAAWESDLERVKAETDFLHNIPSLIGEKNVERHRYFLNAEVATYTEWASAPDREELKNRMEKMYQPILKEMKPIIDSWE